MSKKVTFLAYTPFTGLGLYGGFRGNRWLRNRIKIFKQFVIPSMLNQTDGDFIHWVSWRPEERENPQVKELHEYMSKIRGYKFVFTYNGLCFWDDKFDDNGAGEKLGNNLKWTLPDLQNYIGDTDEVQWLLCPSDDLYARNIVASIKNVFESTKNDGYCHKRGYICNYHTKEILEYNPKTNPPFYAIRFSKEQFFDYQKHMAHTALKVDSGKYRKGTPCPSHEYLPECVRSFISGDRGFLVGCHGENISTHFNHPYGGLRFKYPESKEIEKMFGIDKVNVLQLPVSIKKWLMRKLPFKAQKKIRYIIGEVLYTKFYNFIRD